MWDIRRTFSILPLHVSKPLLGRFSKVRRKGNFHSVFKNCLNGLIDHNYLFNIIPETVWINPRSVQITQEDWGKYRMNEIEPGDDFYIWEEILFIPSLTINFFLKKAKVWDPEETQLSNIYPSVRILKNLEVARGMIQEGEDPSLFSNIFETVVQQRILFLRQSVCEGSFPRIKEAITSLVGLGPGLTPSCDDFLIGFMAALHFMGKQDHELQHYGRKICGLIALVSRGKTNLISEQMLLEAAMGRFSLPVIKMMKNLLTKDEEGILKASIHELLSMGASSGNDTLRGILWGIEFLLEPRGK
jgi:hypothetical protein